MIVFDPLWITMKKKKISQYKLIKEYGFSTGQLSRLRNNNYVSTHTIAVLCSILDCSISEIMEYRPDTGLAMAIAESAATYDTGSCDAVSDDTDSCDTDSCAPDTTL